MPEGGAADTRRTLRQQIGQVAASIREWGWTIPILVDESGGVIAGHARLLAARKLGLVDVARQGRVRLVRGAKARLCARGQ